MRHADQSHADNGERRFAHAVRNDQGRCHDGKTGDANGNGLFLTMPLIASPKAQGGEQNRQRKAELMPRRMLKEMAAARQRRDQTPAGQAMHKAQCRQAKGQTVKRESVGKGYNMAPR